MKPYLYYLHTLSALHCGTGQSIGVVDLPIARDRATHLPLVPGSSVRGVLREEFAVRDSQADKKQKNQKKLETTLFGPAPKSMQNDQNAFAGALAIGDAHLLLLPVRALAGIIAYVTCPYVLRHYAQDIARCGVATPPIPQIKENHALHATDCENVQDKTIVLEDLDLSAAANTSLDEWAAHLGQWLFADDAVAQHNLSRRLVLLPDAVFSYLAETATEIRTRIAINPETGTVQEGALWTEENLPAETVLWGIYAISDSRNPEQEQKASHLSEELHQTQEWLIQLGGNAAVGRGLSRLLLSNHGSTNPATPSNEKGDHAHATA